MVAIRYIMTEQKPEIIELLTAVETKYKQKLQTTTDFEVFSMCLKENQLTISASTLKRLWGYVSDEHHPRLQTLDLLSQYVGFSNFSDYCLHLKKSTAYNSSFFTTKQIQSKDLSRGDNVEIGWAPNRYVRLQYEGRNRFRVLIVRNTKLLEGDYFETACFLLGQPLLVSYVQRGNRKTAPFIAGRNGGLSLLNKINNE